jgi:hypothetical protein
VTRAAYSVAGEMNMVTSTASVTMPIGLSPGDSSAEPIAAPSRITPNAGTVRGAPITAPAASPPTYPRAERRQPARVRRVDRVVPAIPVEVRVPAAVAQRIAAQEAAEARVVEPRAQEHQAAVRVRLVPLAPHEAEGRGGGPGGGDPHAPGVRLAAVREGPVGVRSGCGG